MGNFITKSAHISLLKLVKDSVIGKQNQDSLLDVIRSVLCLKDQANNLYGTSWLIPLMLHRESQIRSVSFSLIAVLVNEPVAMGVLLTSQTGIWSIAFNVLLNCNECSIVRTQACGFLVNLTNSMGMNNQTDIGDTNNITLTCLQSLLNDLNFYPQIAVALTSFYPYDTYSLAEFIRNRSESTEASICSPLLVSSIAQLLYNLNVLMPEEATLLASNSGTLSLLASYIKPINLLNNKWHEDNNWRMNEDMIHMLFMICRYLNLCYELDTNCLLSMVNNNTNLVYDLVECLGKIINDDLWIFIG